MGVCGHHHEHPGLGGPDLASELARAQAHCEASDERLTAPRRRVLQLLLQASHPVKAYDLIAAFGEDGSPAKPPTVYRALEFLSRQGFAHRIESLNAYVACRQHAQGHAAAFLICDCCGCTREVVSQMREPIEQMSKAAGYSLTGVTIEAHGLCADCRN